MVTTQLNAYLQPPGEIRFKLATKSAVKGTMALRLNHIHIHTHRYPIWFCIIIANWHHLPHHQHIQDSSPSRSCMRLKPKKPRRDINHVWHCVCWHSIKAQIPHPMLKCALGEPAHKQDKILTTPTLWLFPIRGVTTKVAWDYFKILPSTQLGLGTGQHSPFQQTNLQLTPCHAQWHHCPPT